MCKEQTRLNMTVLLAVIAVQVVLWTGFSVPAFADCELAKLLASDGEEGDYFGTNTAISGDVAVIGAMFDNDKDANSGSAYIFRYNGSSWDQEAKLLASDGAEGDVFGKSVAVSGDTALVGAYLNDDKGERSGSAYIFRYNGSSWVQEAKLLASDGAAGDYFGYSVAISGDTAVIGARWDDGKGSAYIYRFNGSIWQQKGKLTAFDGEAADCFGTSVAISGDTVVIGAGWDDDKGANSGSAYIYHYNGSSWQYRAKLLASDGAANDLFAYRVAISGGTVLLGSVGDDVELDSGSAYIFRFDGTNWVEEAKLLASDVATEAFGYRVAISGDTALIGAFCDDDKGERSGSAYIFHYNGSTWQQKSKLLASDGAAYDWLGYSVAISGDTAVIGAIGDDDNGESSGSAYIFKLEGSTWEEKLLPSDGEAGEDFGSAVDVFGGTAVIGAHCDDDNGHWSGSAYIYRFNGSSWDEEAKLLASDGDVNDVFGRAVGIFGDTAVIGAPWDDDFGANSGSAYIFRFDGTDWIQEYRMYIQNIVTTNYEFGYSVDIFGDTVIVGAPGENYYGDYYSGAAYIYRFNGINAWVQEDRLWYYNPPGDRFGEDVAIFGNTIVVGVPGDDDNGEASGSAHIFRFNSGSWSQESQLTASDAAEYDSFGKAVAIFGDTAVIAAPGDRDNGDFSGSAYVFRFDGTNWIEEAKLTAFDGAEGDVFGVSVAIFGQTIVVGAYRDNEYDIDSGSAYVFHYDGSSWVSKGKYIPSDGQWADNFGVAVSIFGDTALMGAYHDDDNGTDSGSAYVFGLSMNPGDLDLDNDVDFVDYCMFSSYWMESNCGPCNCDRADFTRDGSVDGKDLSIWAQSWLEGM